MIFGRIQESLHNDTPQTFKYGNDNVTMTKGQGVLVFCLAVWLYGWSKHKKSSYLLWNAIVSHRLSVRLVERMTKRENRKWEDDEKVKR